MYRRFGWSVCHSISRITHKVMDQFFLKLPKTVQEIIGAIAHYYWVCANSLRRSDLPVLSVWLLAIALCQIDAWYGQRWVSLHCLCAECWVIVIRCANKTCGRESYYCWISIVVLSYCVVFCHIWYVLSANVAHHHSNELLALCWLWELWFLLRVDSVYFMATKMQLVCFCEV